MRHLQVIPYGLDPLNAIEIPVPCQVPWDAMTGNEQVRHCGECRQNVYNVASFTRAEALQLLASRAGRVCLRIFRRPDGTVLTSDCRERLRAARKRGWLVFAGALLIVAWAQICAQAVGLMGLRRLVGAGFPGSPPGSALGKPPLLDPPPRLPQPPTMGLPPLSWAEQAMGEQGVNIGGGVAGRIRHGTKGKHKPRP
jgi:hypothetical protein